MEHMLCPYTFNKSYNLLHNKTEEVGCIRIVKFCIIFLTYLYCSFKEDGDSLICICDVCIKHVANWTCFVARQELTGGVLAGESTPQAPASAAMGARDVLTREPEKETAEREERLPSAVVQDINIDSR